MTGLEDDRPTVTVGIPFHAGIKAEHFRQAVESILSQSLLPQQVHLIQDGPVPEELAALARSYAADYHFVQHLVIPVNSGLPYALNRSILLTATRYYARMDADDICHPERLKKQVSYLEQHSEIEILGTWALEFKRDPGGEVGVLKKMPLDRAGIESFFHYRDPFVHPSVMFRREVFARIGLYDARFRTNQDTELWARALKFKVGVANLPEALLYFRAEGVVRKRANLDSVVRLVKARYRYNTWSLKYNFLKVISLLFRLLPSRMQEWGYRNLR
ncbi:MAG TPA: glycosyltransferase [Firmicutes bacterium]|nr:glycosyltransferase [Bacillota bacterium]